MTTDRILSTVRTFEGLLELAPEPGSEHPEISWGDHYFYFAPDGVVPTNRQPYATIVTKDYPGDTEHGLDAPGRWRLNVHVGADVLAELVDPATVPGGTDVFERHPLYGDHGWVCVVDPGPATLDHALGLLAEAHAADRARVERREGL